MYTRHFYRLDEVAAALQYSICSNRVEEALFWSNELYSSEEYDVLTEALFQSWFHSIGLGNILVLEKILSLNVHSEEEIYNLVYGMSTLKNSMKDCTLPVMFLYGISNAKYKNRNVYFTLPPSLAIYSTNQKLDTFIRATLLGKYLESWLLYDKNISDTILETIMNVKFKNNAIKNIIYILSKSNLNKWYKSCAIIGLLNSSEEVLLSSTANGSIKNLNNESRTIVYAYNSILENRKRRVYPVPKACLYGKTKRGSMTYNETNISELYNPDTLVENSSIIQHIEEKYGSYEDFAKSDAMESFSEIYFPDDIPDEWSLEDQQKSHGCGVNQPSDKPMLRRYFTRWTDLKTGCKIWDKETIVCCAIDRLQKEFNTFYFETTFHEKYEKKSSGDTTWNMKSLKYVLSTLE